MTTNQRTEEYWVMDWNMAITGGRVWNRPILVTKDYQLAIRKVEEIAARIGRENVRLVTRTT